MVIRINKNIFAFILFCFVQIVFSFAVLNAQETRAVHRFSWSGGEYALRYEVVFQRMEGNEFATHLREFTAERSVEITLPVGRYRFQVIPYDLLDRPSEPSQWSYVEVRQMPQTAQIVQPPAQPQPAQPQPAQVQPAPTQLETQIVQPPAQVQPAPTQTETQIVQPPVQVQPAPTQPETQIVQPPAQPQPAQVQPAPTQPAQPQTETSPEDEQVRERSEPSGFIPLYVSAAWSPVLPVYGEDFGVTAAGVIARISAVFETPFDMSIGPEITVAFDSGEHVNLSIGINLLLLKWIVNEKAGLGFKLGAALPIMSHHEQIGYNIGVCFRSRIASIFWLDCGVDYLHVFGEIPSGCLRPWIGLGLQF
ncbi:MAG: hypothetical protein FWC01_05195 [Treponema sp.]|nr:hypothetical protein [Treponema sp.]MCL2237281.1 hypothetical protein [Treponema sp.]